MEAPGSLVVETKAPDLSFRPQSFSANVSERAPGQGQGGRSRH